MVTLHSFPAAGQRYALSHRPAWRVDHQLTVLVVGRDLLGKVWVTFRGPDGEVRTRLANQFETAVAAGDIVPLANGPVAYC